MRELRLGGAFAGAPHVASAQTREVEGQGGAGASCITPSVMRGVPTREVSSPPRESRRRRGSRQTSRVKLSQRVPPRDLPAGARRLHAGPHWGKSRQHFIWSEANQPHDSGWRPVAMPQPVNLRGPTTLGPLWNKTGLPFMWSEAGQQRRPVTPAPSSRVSPWGKPVTALRCCQTARGRS